VYSCIVSFFSYIGNRFISSFMSFIVSLACATRLASIFSFVVYANTERCPEQV